MRYRFKFILGAAFLAALSGCASQAHQNTASLNVTGVDYNGKGISWFAAVDPDDPQNRGGGGPLTPYSAGGIRCCFSVPKAWHEGLQVDVVFRYPLEGDSPEAREADRERREAAGLMEETVRVDIPRYETPGKGTLWVQFLPDKQARVVVSHLTPPHEDFPGEVKGWPVPSDEYRRKLIDRDIGLIRSRLDLNQRSLEEFNKYPNKTVQEYWDVFKRTRSKKINQFEGASDPEFKEFLESYLIKYIESDQKRIRALEEARP